VHLKGIHTLYMNGCNQPTITDALKGNKIAISNLYWIIASQIGSVILGYYAFNQSLSTREYFAVALLILATIVQFSGSQ